MNALKTSQIVIFETDKGFYFYLAIKTLVQTLPTGEVFSFYMKISYGNYYLRRNRIAHVNAGKSAGCGADTCRD